MITENDKNELDTYMNSTPSTPIPFSQVKDEVDSIFKRLQELKTLCPDIISISNDYIHIKSKAFSAINKVESECKTDLVNGNVHVTSTLFGVKYLTVYLP